MHRDVLKHLLNKRPFKAFEITVSSDDVFSVEHPETAYLGERFIAVVQVRPGEEESQHSHMVWIDYDHIVCCQPVRNIPF